MRSDTEVIKRSTVRLLGKANGNVSFGTGVFVSESAILSARHVLDPAGNSTRGLPTDPSLVRGQSSAFSGDRVIDEVMLPSTPDVDLALAILRPPKSVNREFCCEVRADPYASVNVGDEVSSGKIVCIIEAMKLFNEIESEVKGKIVKVLVEDASPVEYDQPLFLVEPA